jgi:hypothetical protein
MQERTGRLIRNGVIGGVVGSALGFVPLVLLVAPLLGGGVGGYLERGSAKRGALAGAVAGVVMAAVSTLITGVVLTLRFGEFPVGGGPLRSLGIAALLSLVATLGQILVAGIGGALGALLADGRASAPTGSLTGVRGGAAHAPSWQAIAGGLGAGAAAFLAVTFSLTVVLDPLVWPSLLVALPIGAVAGASAAVLGYRYLAREPEETINWRAVGIGVLVVVLVFGLLLVGLSVLGQQRVEQSAESTYEYRVTLSTDQSLENATVYVPMPTADGDTELAAQFVQNVRYERNVPALRDYEPDPAPVNFTYERVETEHGPMIAISADRIEVSRVYYRVVENGTMGWRERISPDEYDPTDPAMGVRDDGSFTFTVTLRSEERIETANPVGTAPTLTPQYNRTAVACRFGTDTERHRCYEYDSRVYAAYDTTPNATVYVSTELSGRNEWFSGGWTGNEYRDRTSVELLGPGRGWYVASGELEVGSGNYRN